MYKENCVSISTFLTFIFCKKLSFNTKAYRVTFKASKNKFNFIHRENQEEHFIRIFKLPGSRYYKGNNLVFIFRGFLEFFVVLCVLNINDNARVAQNLSFHIQILPQDFLYACGKPRTYIVRVEE